jgi:hypothetical protein
VSSLRSRTGVGLLDQAATRAQKFGSGFPFSLDSGDRFARTHVGPGSEHAYAERGCAGFEDAMEYARYRSEKVGLRVRVSLTRFGSGRGRWVVQPLTTGREKAQLVARGQVPRRWAE